MKDIKVYEALARAFEMEGVDTVFALMGDGNMHFVADLATAGRVKTYQIRHEHCACAMAISYANATGKVGVATVTCGPGLTQTMTALSIAARARLPIVVFAGESPIDAAWYNQHIDQAPLVEATGAAYISAHSLTRVVDSVRDAFFMARSEQRPVVLGVPYDLQKKIIPAAAYRPSTDFLPDAGRIQPDPDHVRRVAERIAAAKRVVVIGGRGAKRSGAAAACEQLAGYCGGYLATSLPVRGLFDHTGYSLGVAGGYAHEVARSVFAEADLVIAVGASLTRYTIDGGKLFPQAEVIQIDPRPQGLYQGRQQADAYLAADGKAGVEAIIRALEGMNAARGSWRSAEPWRRITEEFPDSTEFPAEQGVLDPRAAMHALDRVIPKDWDVVNSSGHHAYFATHMYGRPADRFHVVREFGAIGNGLSYAIGVAAAKPGQPVVLIDGDGGLMMHAQELETIRRYNLRVLVCVLNDGAYGAEIHKLRSDHLDDAEAIFGRNDLGRMAEGYGLRGAVVTELEQFAPLARSFAEGSGGALWDIHVSDVVTSPLIRGSTHR